MKIMTYPDGEVVTTKYNNLMQPIILSNYVSDAMYDASGRITLRTLGNGLTNDFLYYPWTVSGGRLKKMETGTLQDLTYTYDAVGNILGITDAQGGETQVYTYDGLDRLSDWTMNDVMQDVYGYDPVTGNLNASGGVTLSYVDTSHVHAVTGMGGNAYTYDANGNQVTRTIAGVTYTLGYDADNRMVSVSGGGMNASFVYDGDGKRVLSTINEVTTVFVGNHYEVRGSVVSKYYFLGGVRVAMKQAGVVYYPLTDHLGSTTITTDAAGASVSELRYTPWGKTRFESGSSLMEYKFTGQYSNDSDFGLYFYNARWYDAGLKHFSSPDSLIPDPSDTPMYSL